MDYTDAEVSFLVEKTSWWYMFNNSYARPPTVHEMRAKLVQANSTSGNEDHDMFLHNEIVRLNAQVYQLQKEKEQLQKQIEEQQNQNK